MAKFVKFDKEAWEARKTEKKAQREAKKAEGIDKKKLGKRIALGASYLGVAATAAVTAVKLYSMYTGKQAELMADCPVEDAGAELPVEADVEIEAGEV